MAETTATTAFRAKITDIDARIAAVTSKKIALIDKLVTEGIDMRHESRDLMNTIQSEIDALRAERTSTLVVFAIGCCDN
jgi:hypothetical protein